MLSSPRWWLPAWLEPQALVLLVLVLAGASRAGDLTLRGEETRRARVAIEMIETGDWIVPREQARLFPDRPPLGNWLIALSMLAFGDSGLLAIRLPTLLATLATALVVYAYSRLFLGRLGALAAGLAYGTCGQVLQLGMLAETESTMTLLVGSSLLGWHAGWLRGWPRWITWTLGCSLAGLAALAKGPQGPVYFALATMGYLALRRDWRMLFSWAHLLGWAVCAAIIAVWQVPYSREVAWPLVLQTWGHTSAARFDYSSLAPIVKHLVAYPFEIAGCLAPWSVWLLTFVDRNVRRSLGPAREPVVFLTLAIALAFPTCWLAPYARGRYFMPLYPCFAPLVGLAIERACRADALPSLKAFWRRFMTSGAVIVSVAALAVLAGHVLTPLANTPLRQSPAWTAIFAAAAFATAAVLWRSRQPMGEPRGAWVVAVLAAFITVTWAGPLMNDTVRRSDDIADRVARLKGRLPQNARLVSLGRAHHAFVYYYDETIPWLDWPRPDTRTSDAEPGYEYFCFHSIRGRRKSLPFAWEEIDVVPCDRYRRELPVDAMVIGRRLAVNQTAAAPGPRLAGNRGPDDR